MSFYGQDRLAAKPVREIRAARISEDHGKSWYLRALCADCIKIYDTPVRIKDEGSTGGYTCDRCGALNTKFAEKIKGSEN